MAISFDGATKVITLSAGTVTLSVKDLYSRWKDWVQASDNSKWIEAFLTAGGETIDSGAGTSVPLYAFLANGWRVKPQEANHTLAVTIGVLLVNGGGDPFNNTAGNFIVRVNYQQPVQAITVTGSGSGLSAGQATQLAELWKTHGLEVGNPLVVSPTGRTTSGIVQTIQTTGDVTTVQRP